MSTVETWQTDSSSSSDTLDLGEKLGRASKGGEVFLLVSDLGGGKTTLTQGLARGLGSRDKVGSPTFTINRIYKCRDGLSLHHFDFYRLSEAGLIAHELSEVIDDPKTVIVVEWGDVVSNVLPDHTIVIKFDRVATSEEGRRISISYPKQSEYIIKELA